MLISVTANVFLDMQFHVLYNCTIIASRKLYLASFRLILSHPRQVLCKWMTNGDQTETVDHSVRFVLSVSQFVSPSLSLE